MPGIKTTILSLLVCCALGAQSIWLPLDEGNVWVYRATGAGIPAGQTVRVERTAVFRDQTYALVTGSAISPVWIRNSDDGRIMMWDERTSSERVYLDTAAKPGDVSESSVDPCNPTSTVVSREANYTGPLGEFTNALEIKYGLGGCADAGIDTDLLLPYVGLVSRTVQTIAGPRRYELVYARLGTATTVSAPELSFGLSIDNHAPVANLMPPVDPLTAVPVIHAQIRLRNTTAMPLTLRFATGQQYEMVLWNDQGKVVWRYSDGKAFTQAFQSITLSRGELIWAETIRLTGSQAGGTWFNATALPAGRYVLESWLTTTEGRTFTASAPLTLSHVY